MTDVKSIIDPESDAGVILAIDQRLYLDKLGVIALEDGWAVVEFKSFTKYVWETLRTAHTRGDAYQAALDYLIEISINAWDNGGES